MSESLSKRVSPVVLAVLVGAALLLGGCAEKANTLQIGATQFEAESLAAIDRIDELRRQELSAAPVPDAQAMATFALLAGNSTEPITDRDLREWLHPLDVDLGDADAEWEAFIGKLRGQYAAFAGIFASLDRGSLFAAPAVKQAEAPLRPLLVQLAGFAHAAESNPAQLWRRRGAIAEELEFVRDDTAMQASEKRVRYEAQYRLLQEIEAEEARLTRAVVEQCLKAVIVGKELRSLIIRYDRVSVEDIANGLSTALTLAGQVTGRDLSSLSNRTGEVLASIEADPDLEALLDTAIGEAQTALTR
jgi:hypothetical protein